MAELDFQKTYRAHVAKLVKHLPEDAAFEAAVGGDFVKVGKLEAGLLLSLGLTGDHFVVDVGCGSGRLALQLARIPGLRYLGTDVVPDLLGYAERITRRDDWRFVCTEGLSIPCEDNTADFVCFFSVFTHLKHEESFQYLKEARRVLKPGGRIVFSFLEFCIPCHWTIFEHTVTRVGQGDPLNQFMARDAITAWGQHLDLKVEGIFDGDRPHIPVANEPTKEGEPPAPEMSSLGQSVAIYSKPVVAAAAS